MLKKVADAMLSVNMWHQNGTSEKCDMHTLDVMCRDEVMLTGQHWAELLDELRRPKCHSCGNLQRQHGQSPSESRIRSAVLQPAAGQ